MKEVLEVIHKPSHFIDYHPKPYHFFPCFFSSTEKYPENLLDCYEKIVLVCGLCIKRNSKTIGFIFYHEITYFHLKRHREPLVFKRVPEPAWD